jgi:hypothetical protein
MIVAGGEACFALAMEWRLWHGRRAYRASPGKARFPPNCDVHGCDPLCPLYVDSGRIQASRLRKQRLFADRSANASYPPLCCPSGSLPVRDESAISGNPGLLTE